MPTGVLSPLASITATSLILAPARDADELELLSISSGICLSYEGNDGILAVAGVDQEYAESSDTEGGKLSRSRPTNAPGTLNVLVFANDAATLAARHQTLQQTVNAVIAGGPVAELRFTPPGGNEITWELQSAVITQVPWSGPMFKAYVTQWQIALVSLPYAKRARSLVASGDNIGSSDPYLLLDIPPIDGSAEALLSVDIVELASVDRGSIEYGLDVDYDPDAPSQLLFKDGDFDLTHSNSTPVAAPSSAISTNMVEARLVQVPVGIARISGPHVGRFRVKTRVKAKDNTVEGPVRVCFAWGSGGLLSTNPWVVAPLSAAAWHEVDLGLIDIRKAELGTQQWIGEVQAVTDVSGDAIDLDVLILVPAGRWGLLDSIVQPAAAAEVLASDGFAPTPDPLVSDPIDGHALDGGLGSWATTGVAADGFLYGGLGPGPPVIDHAFRSGPEASDTKSVITGIGSFGDTWIQMNYLVDGGLFEFSDVGAIARWVDANNYVRATVQTGFGVGVLRLVEVVAGVESVIAESQVTPYLAVRDVEYQLRLWAGINGWIAAWLGSPAIAPGSSPVVGGASTELATGESLESGTAGIYCGSLGSVQVIVDNVIVWSAEDASIPALASDHRLTITHDVALATFPRGGGARQREVPRGAYLKVPANRPSRLMVKARDNPVGSFDTGHWRSFSVAVAATPRVQVLG